MRNLNLSAVTPSVGFPPKSGTWDFLQMAYKECIDAIVQSYIGPTYSPSTAYVLQGCVLTGGLGWSVSAGAIYFNGQLYISPAQGGTAGVGTFLVNLAVTQYTGTDADPVIFTDGVARNVHNITQISYGYGTSGTGTVCDFTDLCYIYPVTQLVTGDIDGITITGERDRYNLYSVASNTTNAIVLNGARAKVGSEIILVSLLGASGDTISISTSGGAGYYLLTGSASLTLTNAVAYIRIKCVAILGGGGGQFTVEIFNP